MKRQQFIYRVFEERDDERQDTLQNDAIRTTSTKANKQKNSYYFGMWRPQMSNICTEYLNDEKQSTPSARNRRGLDFEETYIYWS